LPPIFYAVGGGESGYIAPDPADTSVFFAGSYGGFLSRLDRETGQQRAVNIYPNNPMGYSAIDIKERFQWTFPIVFSPVDPSMLYASSQHVWRTTTGGQSWERVSPNLSRSDPKTMQASGGPITRDQTGVETYAVVFTIAPSRQDANTVWTGSDDGWVHVTRDGAKTWQKVTPPDLPELVRGVPWAHGAMLTLNQLDGFDEAELVGARVAASNMAFVSPPAEADGGPEPENPLDTEVSPGQVLELPAGYTVHEFNPTKPQESHFPKRMLRKVAASLGIDYSDMSNDLESVNFSSIRAGTINARDGYRILQKWIATNLYQDVYVTWLMTNPGLVTASQLMQVMYPIWRPRGFDWVDPSKDVKADVDAVLMGFKTRTEIAANHGKDFEEMIDQLAAEQAYIDKKGLKFGKDGAPEEKEGSDDEPAAGKAKKAGAK
jgi:hypothetical protein